MSQKRQSVPTSNFNSKIGQNHHIELYRSPSQHSLLMMHHFTLDNRSATLIKEEDDEAHFDTSV